MKLSSTKQLLIMLEHPKMSLVAKWRPGDCVGIQNCATKKCSLAVKLLLGNEIVECSFATVIFYYLATKALFSHVQTDDSRKLSGVPPFGLPLLRDHFLVA